MDYTQRLPKPILDHILGGRYRVVRQLRMGGFSQTFLAEDTQLPGNPRCVVKQLKPQMRNLERWAIAKRLFDTEAKVLYQLGHHDQIPRLFAHFEEHQEFYLVQELVEGESLQELFLPEHPWTEQRVIVLLRDILQILVFVHEQNVIHRDVKLSNIICRKQDGRMMLIDFGAVKQVSAPLPDPTDATDGQMMTISIGTQGYVPTEQLSGSPRFSSDIYAVGIIGIQILTGIHPHLLEREGQTNEIIWRASKPKSSETAGVQISPELVSILDRMVCYHFRDRYQMAAEPLQALEELLQHRSDIVPTAEFAALASESAIAWGKMEESFKQSSSLSTVMPPGKRSMAASNDSEVAIAPTSFEAAPKLVTAKTRVVARAAVRGLQGSQLPSLQSFAYIRSIFHTSLQKLRSPLQENPNIWKMGIIAGLGITAIATLTDQFSLLKMLTLPRSAQVAPTVIPTVTPVVTPVPLPLLPCREPSLPSLPSKKWDYEYPNGTHYWGPMAKGRPVDGRVLMVFSSGNRYDGEIQGEQRVGCGTYTFANGKRYIGQFKNDRFEGQGMWILQNGDRYIGSFQSNRCQGQGIFIFANGSSKRGIWRDGELIDGDLSCNR